MHLGGDFTISRRVKFKLVLKELTRDSFKLVIDQGVRPCAFRFKRMKRRRNCAYTGLLETCLARLSLNEPYTDYYLYTLLKKSHYEQHLFPGGTAPRCPPQGGIVQLHLFAEGFHCLIQESPLPREILDR